MVSSDEAPGSFRVVFLGHDESRVRVSVFSSGTREWQILPWEEPAPAQPAEDQYWLLVGTQVNGSLYWAHVDQAYLLVLDTATLQFSCIDLPVQPKGQGHIYSVGETEDGKLCIVCAIDFLLIVLHRRADVDGVDRWMLHNTFSLVGDVLQATGRSRDEHGALKVLGIIDGIVYLSTMETFADARLPCRFLTFWLMLGYLVGS
uniref:F-box protein AT5G49610-like beta-propeller domain-containing protein n=1 Tax=Arundo donax TaxID=35708 RepID=A0A0A9TKA6_ARUDO